MCVDTAPGPYGLGGPSLARAEHLLVKDWDWEYRQIRKLVVYLCRYMRQPLDTVLDMTMREARIWVHYVSDAVGKENKAGSGEA